MSAMIQCPLDLPDVQGVKTELTAAGHLLMTGESILEGIRCRRCGQEMAEFHGPARPLRLCPLPVLEHPLYLEIRPKHYRCPYCPDPPTTPQRCHGYEPHSPLPGQHPVLRALIHSPVSDVSRKLGLGAEAVEDMVDRHLAQAVDGQRYPGRGVLGLDEMALTKASVTSSPS